MNPNWRYHEALAADRRAARRQLDFALSQQSGEQTPAAQLPEVIARPVVSPPVVEWCYYDQRGEQMSDHSTHWMLVLLLMLSTAMLTVLLFIALFVTGMIGG